MDDNNVTIDVIGMLEKVKGMTKASFRDAPAAGVQFILKDKTKVKTWKNPVGFMHVFLERNNEVIYGGYVGWVHNKGLCNTLDRIRELYAID
jgi:hypothetical protein